MSLDVQLHRHPGGSWRRRPCGSPRWAGAKDLLTGKGSDFHALTSGAALEHCANPPPRPHSPQSFSLLHLQSGSHFIPTLHVGPDPVQSGP